MLDDLPKSLGNERARADRLASIHAPHVAPLNRWVAELRSLHGHQIPYFDPMDGGIDAECLFLLEAPGPKAVASGFISRNNPDETAKNFFLLNQEADIDRTRTVTWNVVPWYIGTAGKIRAATPADRKTAEPALAQLLAMLRRLRVVVLIGQHAQRARALVDSLVPGAQIFTMPHPSPMFVNRAPGNRQRILDCLSAVANALGRG